jgi:ATP-binding cassette, subfamily C (CFTR/MRP), member 1
LSQFLTFAAYAIAAKIQGNQPLSVSQAVMALSLLNILIFPLGFLLEAIPQCFTAMGCIDRIQQFLTQESRSERRHIEGMVDFQSPPGRVGDHRNRKDKQVIPLVPVGPSLAAGAQNRSIVLTECSFWWDHIPRAAVTTTLGKPSQGSLTVIVGPVGSGKSTFLKALIGETYSLSGELSLSVTQIAFCDQTPWLTNGAIRSNIVGESGIYDEAWYNTVVHACDLETDFAQHSGGDQTVVGSRGVKLSGGQKQRIVRVPLVGA